MRAKITPFLKRFVKRLARSKSGNAMLFVALGMPVLIGAAGYAVDMAQLYMWKRELQHSVDQAALAGAWALAYDKNSNNYETRALQEFNSNEAITTAFASTPVVQLGNYDGGNNNSVIVSASVARRLPFSSFLVDKPLYMSARAQATYAAGATYKACLMALKEGQSGTFTVGGNATVKAKCGLGALSCEDDAIVIDGSSSVDTDSIVTCGTADVPSGLESKLTENASGVEDSFADLPAPTPDNETQKTFSCPNGNSSTTHYLSPGRYTGGLNLKCKVVFTKGVYVIDGGVFDMTDQKSDITGTNVMFILRNGAQIKIGGSGNAGKVNLTPMEAADFVGTANEPYKDRYASMLFYEDKTGQTSEVEHRINGNSQIQVRGTFYLPNGNVTVNGDSGINVANPLCFQLWALTLKIQGNTKLTTTCASEVTNGAGSAAGGVRLVA